MCIMLDVARRRATMLESVADCCFPSFGSVNLWVMCFWVYVYRRLKGLFVFPLIALWLVSLKTCLKHYYLWPDAFFFLTKSYWIMSVAPSPEFQMHTVEKLAIASAWQVGSISVLSPCNAWASSWLTGTTADCAAIRVRLPGHWSNAAMGRRSRSCSTDQNGSFQEPTPTGAKWAGVVRPHLRQAWLTDGSVWGPFANIPADLYFSRFIESYELLSCITLNMQMFPLLTHEVIYWLLTISLRGWPFYVPSSINRILFTILYIWYIAHCLTTRSTGSSGLLHIVYISFFIPVEPVFKKMY